MKRFDLKSKKNVMHFVVRRLTWTALPDVVCITVAFGLNKTVPLGMATGACVLLPAAVCITDD